MWLHTLKEQVKPVTSTHNSRWESSRVLPEGWNDEYGLIDDTGDLQSSELRTKNEVRG